MEKLDAYRHLLTERNRQMDLTSVPDGEIPLRHLGDSLLPVLQYPALFPQGCSLADVGTGAGLPGIPLAIARPDIRVTLIEALRKRCAFLEEVKEKLGLANVTVIPRRAEEAGRDTALREAFDRTVSRAVAGLPVLAEYLLPLTKTGGMALCWKGPAAEEELAAGSRASLLLGGGEAELFPVAYPGETRCLVRLPKLTETPSRYPRRPGIPAKRPL